MNSLSIGRLALGVFLLFMAPLANAAPAPESFAPLVEKLTPAVVNIATTQKIKSGGMGNSPFMFQFPDDPKFDPFRQFFENFGQNQKGGMVDSPREREVTSLGSGFIVDPSGYVVTNNHVIAEAEAISVILQDDTTLEAELVGRDPKTDLALLKVKSDKPLPFVNFGDSDSVRVGDWVVAIGNPFGLGGTVTAGIVSARSRSINAGPFDDFLQTDAAINRGNSGGPMFDTNGQVIGVNTAIFSPSGGNIGIGFAVPSTMAKSVISQLKEHGRTFRGWLGVKIQDVTEEIASAVGLKESAGALVLEITPNSPATKTDLKPGDVILSFDGKGVNEMRKLPRIVAETPIGKKVEIEYWRDGKRRKTRVELGELDEGLHKEASHKNDAGNDEMPKGTTTREVAGLKLATINDELRQRYRLPKQVTGALIGAVKRDSEAAKQNIRPGDVIVRVNDADITDADQVVKALEKAGKAGRDYALVRLLRNKDELFITLPTK